MSNEVIFDVLNNVRYNVLGGVKTTTPTQFSQMSDEEKNELYRNMFDAWCSTCETLTALMTIEKNYKQLQNE